MPTERAEFFTSELVQELRYVANAMREETDIEKKIFLFSAAYGITSRTFRYVFSKDVLLADFVLTQVYELLTKRIEGIGVEGSLPLKLDRLSDELEDLAAGFEQNKNLVDPLKNILTIGYSVIGNGIYLEQKGELKI
jgi:hypothetical protein